MRMNQRILNQSTTHRYSGIQEDLLYQNTAMYFDTYRDDNCLEHLSIKQKITPL